MPDSSAHLVRGALAKLWAPVPWLLEASIVLQVVLHKYGGAAVIGGLLVFNAALAYFQESRAQATLRALRSRLALEASVQRDGTWKTVPAEKLVCGDVVQLSLGGVVAADVRLLSGSVLLDQSMLTGESLPIEAGAGAETYAGALVRRGEAVAQVTATGVRTKFGRSAELIRTARVVSSQQKAVLHLVRNLATFNGCVIVLIGSYAFAHGLGWSEIIPLLLTAVLAAIPVALPATFTLAAAIGARSLATQNVLPTRLSAVDEAASVAVLCVDKTGTLTGNQLSVTAVHPMHGYEEPYVLGLAALASSEGGQDTVDAAIRAAAAHTARQTALPVLKAFVPFDPASKIAEASVIDDNTGAGRVVKGAFAAVFKLASASPEAATQAEALERQGFRVLAVAMGPAEKLELIGLLALSDPPRKDSKVLVSELKNLGVHTVMLTGDARTTAAIVAQAVGIEVRMFPGGPLPAGLQPEDFSIFAGMLPEGKFDLVKAFQRDGHGVGMCGDGANDAPALRQAQCGIAVSTATDVAKSAAGIVLTEPGLGGIVAAVKEGRITFQRILTYALNSTLKKIVQVLLLAAGLLMTGHAVLTPMLIIIVMITGDFLAMSLTTDRVTPSATPNSWQIGKITVASTIFACGLLAFCLLVLAVGKFELGLSVEALRTITVIALVYGSQVTTFVIRDRQRFWGLRPSAWLVWSSVANVAIITGLALRGVAMTLLPLYIVASVFGAAVLFGLLLNSMKAAVFARCGIA